jgi:hypothetical protein
MSDPEYLSEAEEPEIPDGPAAAQILDWLRCQLPRPAIAALTGTDCDALQAAAGILALYQRTSNPELLNAFRTCVLIMQPKTRELAYHAVAQVAEWDTRAKWWGKAGLWDHSHFTPETAMICKHSPEGRPFRR